MPKAFVECTRRVSVVLVEDGMAERGVDVWMRLKRPVDVDVACD